MGPRLARQHRGRRGGRNSVLSLDVIDSHAFPALRASNIDLVVKVSGVSDKLTVVHHPHVDKSDDFETLRKRRCRSSDTVVSTWTPSSTPAGRRGDHFRQITRAPEPLREEVRSSTYPHTEACFPTIITSVARVTQSLTRLEGLIDTRDHWEQGTHYGSGVNVPLPMHVTVELAVLSPHCRRHCARDSRRDTRLDQTRGTERRQIRFATRRQTRETPNANSSYHQ